jgi:PAS domain S-box-containing protein
VLVHDFAETEDPPPSRDYAVFQDVMVAPITWLGEVRGALGVCSREPNRFDAATVEVLEAFARFSSLALDNAESFEQGERQARVQRGFFRIADALGSPLSFDEALPALAQAAADALGGSAAVVLKTGDAGLVLSTTYGLSAAAKDLFGAGLAEEAMPLSGSIRDGRIIAAGSLADDDRFGSGWRSALVAAGYGALLSAPVAGGTSRAAVVLFEGARTFTDDDIALASHLADAARGALERSELYEAERRARWLSQRLAELGVRLVTDLDPAVVLRLVVDEAPRLLEADAAAVRLLEADELVVRATAGASAEGLEGTRTSSGAGFLGEVAQSRAPVVVDDVRSMAAAVQPDPLLVQGMTCCVAVPMVAPGGGLYGVVTVYGARPRPWRHDEIQALSALGALASAALSNAELYKRVAEEKERSEAILANIADGIVATDREERIVLWNAMAEQITGVPVGEALGRQVGEVLGRELRSDGATTGEREVAILRGGKEVFLSVAEAVMFDAAGAVAGRIFAFRDVSAERLVEQLKSDFVSTVSHELRTPLTSIYGFAETLLRADVEFGDKERETFLGYIASESERLIEIVDDLLGVARLEAGTLGVAAEPIDVGEVVHEAVGRMEAVPDARHRFSVDLADGEIQAEGDREKLAQVVLHLLENAVKFSPDGGSVAVSVRRRTGTVEVRVTDKGVGISQLDQQRIFTKFYRAGSGPTSGIPGTGLGLFLVRGLLAAMNGRIWVESHEGVGSTFAFELPAWRSAGTGIEPVETAGHA